MSKNALRYASIDAMPKAMQEAARKAMGEIPRPQAPQPLAAGSREDRPNKYGNLVTHVDGIRFDSKREARYYEQLKLRKAAGEVSYWLRQVPIHLPGGTRYVLDFLVFFVDNRGPEYVDVKGRETKEFRIKRREVEHHYPIKVVLA